MALQISEPGQTTNTAQKNITAVGIDLGTTHSLVSITEKKGTTRVLKIEGQELVPSIVAYSEAENKFVVGQRAQKILNETPDLAAASVKRLMDPLLSQEAENLPALSYLESTPGEMRRFKLGSHTTNPIQVSAEILHSLKIQTEALLGEPVDHAVITVPAYFSETARGATRLAAGLAGWKVLRLLSEPTAAALKFGLDKKNDGHFLIFDLGGGTFDVSILNLEQGVFQVLATGGDTHLGGDDIDHLIKNHLIEKHHLSDLTPKDHQTLILVSEELKKRLQNVKKGAKTAQKRPENAKKEPLKTKIGNKNYAFFLEKDELNQLTKPILSKIDKILKNTLKSAKLTPSDITDVVLVGGSTRLIFLHKFLEDLFQKPPLFDMHPDHVVAEGAALQAHALTHKSDSLLLDVTALSLGIETMGGLVEKIIPRNSPIPATITQEFTTFQDNQSAMSIHVLQGERELAADCRSLGRFSLKGIPPLPSGFARIFVTFSIDADGLLTVSAQEKTTGTHQSIEITPSHGLKDHEIKDMLLSGYHAASEDIEKRLKEQEWIKLQFTLGLCEKLLNSSKKSDSYEQLKHLYEEGKSLSKTTGTTDIFRNHTKKLEQTFKKS